MFSDEEVWEFIRRVLTLTRQGKVSWVPYKESTEDKHESMMRIGEFTFFVHSVDGDGLPPIKFEIYKTGVPDGINPVGRYEMSVEPESSEEGDVGRLLVELYGRAWPMAFGVANIYDELDNALRGLED